MGSVFSDAVSFGHLEIIIEEKPSIIMIDMGGHKDGDPDKTKEEYDADNHADQENDNNDEYDK